MNQDHREKLNEMLKDNDDAVDNTDYIREQKYSDKIKLDVEKLMIFKSKHKELLATNRQEYDAKIKEECSFLFSTFPEVLDKLKEDNIDMKLMFQIIQIYRQIEEGKIDQHEASFMLGTVLKEIYVDTVISKEAQNREKITISYREWLSQKNIM
jgi:hypothetical protein